LAEAAVPFVAVLALNAAVIWRTVRVSPYLRRSFGGGQRGHVTLSEGGGGGDGRTRRWASTQATMSSEGGSGSWRLQTIQSLTSLPSTHSGTGTTLTAAQVDRSVLSN